MVVQREHWHRGIKKIVDGFDLKNFLLRIGNGKVWQLTGFLIRLDDLATLFELSSDLVLYGKLLKLAVCMELMGKKLL